MFTSGRTDELVVISLRPRGRISEGSETPTVSAHHVVRPDDVTLPRTLSTAAITAIGRAVGVTAVNHRRDHPIRFGLSVTIGILPNRTATIALPPDESPRLTDNPGCVDGLAAFFLAWPLMFLALAPPAKPGLDPVTAKYYHPDPTHDHKSFRSDDDAAVPDSD